LKLFSPEKKNSPYISGNNFLNFSISIFSSSSVSG
jgi:hypothetical protein